MVDWERTLNELAYSAMLKAWTVEDVRLPLSVHKEAMDYSMNHMDTVLHIYNTSNDRR